MPIPNDPPGILLDVSTLPTLPQTLVDLIDACNRKDVNIHELGTKVARDVFISTRVLQLVNSAFIGARSTFSNIVQAVIYLGVDTTRNLAISVAVHETFRSLDTYKIINVSAFWHHSLLTAVLARSLAQVTGTADPSEAYLTGLLHDLGKLLLLNGFPEQYRKILQEKGDGDLEFQEKEILGMTHSEAAAFLIRRWHLQSEIADAVSRHHCSYDRIMKESSLAKILFCANYLSHCPLPDITVVAEIVRDILKIGHGSLLSCTEDSLDTAHEIAGYMGVKVSRGSVSELDSPLAPQAEERLADRVMTFSRINGFLDNLVKAEGLDRVFQVTEESVNILFTVDGCLFFLPDDATRELIVCGSSENPLIDTAKKLWIRDGERRGVLASCLESLNIIDSFTFFKENGPAKTDHVLLKIFPTDGFVAVPLVIAGHDPGCMIIGITQSGVARLRNQDKTLLLLADHAGMRLRLEKTYQKHAEELAATRVGAVADVARSIAHEISNPIAILQNALTVLGLKLKGRTELLSDLETIGREIDRIGEISSQLRDLSGHETGLLLEPVDLHAVITDVLNFFQQSLNNTPGIDMSFSLQDDLPVVSSKGTKIRQILGNLIKNAIEAIGDEGVIRVTAETVAAPAETRQEVKISIEDNGPGVLQPDIEDIFHAGVTTKKEGHAGLGLAISRKLAAELGGVLACKKKQRGGMIFSLTLPV